MRDSPQLHTLGHGSHSAAEFIRLLRLHGITTVMDVRSQPYSRWAPQFNQQALSRCLREAGITYRFMGTELGGRPSDPALYEPGEDNPNYQHLAQMRTYQVGIDRLLEAAQIEQVAVVCSEGDHSRCHRHLLITQTLLARGARVLHIRPNGTTIEGELKPRQLSLL